MAVIKRLWALEGGLLATDRGQMVLGESGTVTIPCPSFLMEHDRGLVLMDTGIAPDAATNARAIYGDMADKEQISIAHDQRIDSQLAMIGFKPSDITHVIMSHLHWDHTGGMYLFPQAKFYVMAGELQYAFWPRPGGPLYRREDIDPTRASIGMRLKVRN